MKKMGIENWTMVGVLGLVVLFTLLPITPRRRDQLTLWTILAFAVFFLCRLAHAFWEYYAST